MAAVVVYHAGLPWLRGGFLGVDVFFVLSGFLITSLLLAEWRRRRRTRVDLRAFWRRRARRILPAAYLLLAAVLLTWLWARPGQVAAIRGDALAAFGYMANWWFLFGSQPYFQTAGRPSPFLHLWSLGVEEQFYLLWPPAFLLAVRFRRWAPALLVAAALGSLALGAGLYRAGADPSRIYYGTDTHSAGLLAGAALAFWWNPPRRMRRGRRGSFRRLVTATAFADGLAGVSLAGLAWAFVALDEDSGFLYQGGLGLVALLTVGAIVGVSHPRGRAVAAVLESGPVRWLGLRSYGIYLWHWPLLVLMGSPKLLAPVAIAATLVLAELSYRLVEMPIRRVGVAGVVDKLRLRPAPRLVPAGALASIAAGVLVVVVATAPPPPRPAYLAQLSVDTVYAAPSEVGSTALHLAQLDGDPPSPSPSTLPSPVPTASALPPPPIVAVGDSVMVGAAPALQHAIPGIEIDAREGRQVQTGIDVLSALKTRRRLGEAVVVDLGNNGTFTTDQLSYLMRLLTGSTLVVFVNLKEDEPWTAANNRVLAAAVATYSNAVLVDWVAASTAHPEYFWDDGLHLRPDGAQAYAKLIKAALTSRG